MPSPSAERVVTSSASKPLTDDSASSHSLAETISQVEFYVVGGEIH